MNRKRIVKIVLWTIGLAALTWWISSTLSNNKETLEVNSRLSQISNPVVPVIPGTVELVTYDGSFDALGNFAPDKLLPVMSEASGKIVALNFDNGSYVNEGAVMAKIDDDLLNIELETSRNNLRKAENDLARLKALIGDGGVTQQQVDDATLAIDNIRSKIKALEKQISMTEVKAPISGFVSNKMVEKGSLVSPGVQMALITNTNRMKLQVYLAEDQVVHVRKGREVDVIVDQFPDLKLRGVVKFIDVNATPNKRYLVEVACPNPGKVLRSGMTATAHFGNGGPVQVLAIPREAIVGSLQDAKVYVLEGKKALLRPVQTGKIIGDKVEIRSGLKQGETIVVSGQINLEDGKAIRVANHTGQ